MKESVTLSALREREKEKLPWLYLGNVFLSAVKRNQIFYITDITPDCPFIKIQISDNLSKGWRLSS